MRRHQKHLAHCISDYGPAQEIRWRQAHTKCRGEACPRLAPHVEARLALAYSGPRLFWPSPILALAYSGPRLWLDGNYAYRETYIVIGVAEAGSGHAGDPRLLEERECILLRA